MEENIYGPNFSRVRVYKRCGVCGFLFEKGSERHYTCPSCSQRDYSYLEDQERLTPFDPGGRVRVLEIEEGFYEGRRTAWVEYLEDHPHGYRKGTCGRYFADELRPLDGYCGRGGEEGWNERNDTHTE